MCNKMEPVQITTIGKTYLANDVDWIQHATCEGVFLKHLVKGENTEGKFSCHLVKILAGHEISTHIHADKWELHEVIAGSGNGFLENEEISYSSGNIIVIPQGLNHRVVAGKEDTYLLAKFIPALV